MGIIKAPWGKFEEPIDSSYATNVGDVAQRDGAVVVTANAKLALTNNHVIAQNKVSTRPASGMYVYQATAMFVADVNELTSFPQSGVELSVQSTALIGGTYWTHTAGVQRITNPWDSKWQVWSGAWVTVDGPTLDPNTWYDVRLLIDYDELRYRVTVGHDYVGTDWVSIVPEAKGWTEEATWLTLEAENLWQPTPIVSPTLAKVTYENIKFVRY